MAFQPVPDTAELVLEYTNIDGVQMVNTMYIREANITTWIPAALNGLLDLTEDWVTEFLVPLMSTQVRLTKLTARDLGSENGAIVVRGENIPGTNSALVLPGNVTFAVSFRTGLAGRSYRGRNYFIGLGENQASGNFIVTVTADAIVNAYVQFAAEILLQGWVQVVVSRYVNGALRPTAVATDITQYLYTDLRLDSQRRRLS
jgi:hypothetical protein